MQLYMDRVNAIKTNQDLFQKAVSEVNSAGKSERLKKQIQSCRGEVDYGSNQILNEIEESRVKQQIRATKNVIKEQ